MKYSMLGSAAFLSFALAGAAFADVSSTTTTVTLTPQQQTEVREYVIKENRPSATVEGFEVAPGAVLPPSVAFYSVPQVDKYQYTVVNEKRVLVDPSSRRVVEVIEQSDMAPPASSKETYTRSTTTTEQR